MTHHTRLQIETLEERTTPSALSLLDPVDYGVGRSPRSVTVADFNRDQLPDAAVANSGAGSVSVLLGNGDGTVRPVGNVAVGTNPTFLTSGDVNGDQVTDLMVANTGSNSVAVLVGNGDGTFGPARHFAVGQRPSSITVGDLNEDGNADLAVANGGAATVSVLRGNGDGTFGAAVQFGVGVGGASSVAAADFDHDGHLDLVVANRGVSPGKQARPSTISLLRGTGDGGFGAPVDYAVGAHPVAVVVADLNGDGKADVAVANNDSDTVSVLLGPGDGTLAPARHYPVGRAECLAVGDVDGDGTPDVVTANRHSFVVVLPGTGDGTFGHPLNFWAGTEPVSVAIGDFNGDARADLAVAQVYSGQLSLLLNNGSQPGDGVTVVRDVVYTDGPAADPQRQSLDLYLPAGGSNFPVVVLAYGGQFRNGDKARLSYLAQSLAREGLGVAAINYRITDGTAGQVVHPGHVQDVAQAVAWTYRHVAGFGGNPGEIFLMGQSSGGSLISMVATDRRYLAAHGLSPDVLRGVIGVSSGLYDQRRLYTDVNGPFEDVFGTPEQHWEASPLRYVDGTQPPFLILYGQFDLPGFAADSIAFYQALAAAGSEAQLHMIPDRNHAGMIGRAARPGDPVRELSLEFIFRHSSYELARVESVRVNDGSAQRSMVNSLTVTFDRAVSIGLGAFDVRRADGSLVDVQVTASVLNGKTVAVLTFAGPDVIGDSLADGSYTLTVRADRVHDRWGREMDGDGNGSAGGNRVDGFFRLFGDSDGDRDVGWLDRDLFRCAFGKSIGDAGYLWYFDFEGDGDVDGRDNGEFNRRFRPD